MEKSNQSTRRKSIELRHSSQRSALSTLFAEDAVRGSENLFIRQFRSVTTRDDYPVLFLVPPPNGAYETRLHLPRSGARPPELSQKVLPPRPQAVGWYLPSGWLHAERAPKTPLERPQSLSFLDGTFSKGLLSDSSLRRRICHNSGPDSRRVDPYLVSTTKIMMATWGTAPQSLPLGQPVDEFLWGHAIAIVSQYVNFGARPQI